MQAHFDRMRTSFLPTRSLAVAGGLLPAQSARLLPRRARTPARDARFPVQRARHFLKGARRKSDAHRFWKKARAIKRMRANGTKGPGEWSDPATIIVP